MALSLGVRQGFHGQHGLVWRARISAEIGNLRGALDWYIERGDATAALSLTTGLVCWFQRGDFLQAAGWLEEAFRVDGEAPVTLRAAAAAWHGYFYFNAWITAPAAALAEVGQAVEVLRDGSDPERLGDALLVFAALLNRNGDLDTTRVVLAEAHRVLTAADDRWGLATHDLSTPSILPRRANSTPRKHQHAPRSRGSRRLASSSLSSSAWHPGRCGRGARGSGGCRRHVRAVARRGSGRWLGVLRPDVADTARRPAGPSGRRHNR